MHVDAVWWDREMARYHCPKCRSSNIQTFAFTRCTLTEDGDVKDFVQWYNVWPLDRADCYCMNCGDWGIINEWDTEKDKNEE